MFYCRQCGGQKGWPYYYGMPESFGECEICHKRKPCVDVPSSSLAEIKENVVTLPVISIERYS